MIELLMVVVVAAAAAPENEDVCGAWLRAGRAAAPLRRRAADDAADAVAGRRGAEADERDWECGCRDGARPACAAS